ncbi:UNVERIFIED_CONTAM: hypothetical protein K2H54_014606 [Gekko kuhli]
MRSVGAGLTRLGESLMCFQPVQCPLNCQCNPGTLCYWEDQGSSSVSGSPVLSTSGTSTPRRGRRQLPQTPSTPRPHVSYSPVVRKAAAGPPPPPPPAHPSSSSSSRLASPAPRRYPSLPAEHHAAAAERRRRSRSPALERHTVPPRNDSPRAYRHASSRWSAPHVAQPRHAAAAAAHYRAAAGAGGSGGGGGPDYAAPAGQDACPAYEAAAGSGSGRSPRTSRGGGGGGPSAPSSLSPARPGRRLPNGYYPPAAAAAASSAAHGPAKARGTGARKGLHEPYSETDEDDCC